MFKASHFDGDVVKGVCDGIEKQIKTGVFDNIVIAPDCLFLVKLGVVFRNKKELSRSIFRRK